MNKKRAILAAAVLAILLGLALRTKLYVRNYSFFVDECMLALDVVNHDATNLTGRQGYDQTAPLGFLLSENAAARSFGDGEMTLRSISFIAGLLVLLSFWRLSRRVLTGWSAAAALCLVAVNQDLISYSAQMKQYSLETLVAILILDLSVSLLRADLSSSARLWTSVVCAGLLSWFSFSAVFILAGVGATLLAQSLVHRSKTEFARNAAICAVWVGMLVPVFVLSLKSHMSNSALHEMWTQNFLPWNSPYRIPAWVFARFQELCTVVFNKRLWPMAGLMLAAGSWIAIRRKDWNVIAAGAGLVWYSVAAALQQYPFGGRLLLFMVPGLVIVLVRGGEWAIEAAPSSSRIVFQAVAVLAVLWCVQSAVRAAVNQHTYFDEPREALGFLRQYWQQGDSMAVTESATPCVLYYGDRLKLDRSASILNVTAAEDPQKGTRLSSHMPSGRTWLVEARRPWQERDPTTPVQEWFESHGHKLRRFDAESTSVILFELR